jgi:hypothetical protein
LKYTSIALKIRRIPSVKIPPKVGLTIAGLGEPIRQVDLQFEVPSKAAENKIALR